MTSQETSQQIADLLNDLISSEETYNHPRLALRYDDRVMVIGDALGCSRTLTTEDVESNNTLPDYGTEEYDRCIELDGTCAMDAIHYWVDRDEDDLTGDDIDHRNPHGYPHHHLYIVAGTPTNDDMTIDDDEIILADAQVVACVW